MKAPKHPAKFSEPIMEVFHSVLCRICQPELILDPFAGTGRVHELGFPSVGVEIEPRWAAMHPRTICADALALPFSDSTFDAIVTSPTYGNRMADHHNATERCKQCNGTGSYPPLTRQVCSKCEGKGRRAYVRNTYRHQYGEALHPHNSGQLQWGDAYREFHLAAWTECRRVLRSGGFFLLNVSDHIRTGKVVPVSEWHLSTLVDLGLKFRASRKVPTRRNRHGANRDARVQHELVAVFQLSSHK